MTLLFIFAVLLLPSAHAGHWPAKPRVLVLQSASTAIYQQVVESFTEGIQQSCSAHQLFCPIPVLAVNDLDAQALQKKVIEAGPDLIITIGRNAAQQANKLKHDAKIFYTLIPKPDVSESVVCCPMDSSTIGNQSASALYLDQPLSRQIRLIKEALPGKRKIGIVLGPASQHLQSEIDTSIKKSGLEARFRILDSPAELGPTIKSLLDEVDVLLNVPDPMVHNRRTIFNLLLTTYHARIPVVAFSEAYVKAGALIGIYSTPKQVGQQIADAVKELLATEPHQLPQPANPKYFSVSINDGVARSLGISLPSVETLERIIMERSK